MTTIDHQQAATVAAAKALFVMQHRVAVEKFELNSYAALSAAATREASNALQAAAPHLRAGIAEEVRDLRSQFHDDAKTAFGRIGSSTEAYLNALDDVLALLRRSTND